MSNITVTPALLKDFRKDLEEAVQAVAAKHGLKLPQVGCFRYNATSFTVPKMEFFIENKDAIVPTQASTGDLIGRRFKQGGRIFTVLSPNGDDAFSCITQRNKRFKVKRTQLDEMIAL